VVKPKHPRQRRPASRCYLCGSTKDLWLTVQRKRYRGTAKHLRPLSPEQIAQLESVPGHLWNPPNGKREVCLRGHPYNEENTRVGKNGQRFCLQCERERRGAKARKDRVQEIWDLNFKEYRDHVLQIGSEAGLSAKLRVWLTMQREKIRGTSIKRGTVMKLSESQITQLESVPGFSRNPLAKKDHCLRGHPTRRRTPIRRKTARNSVCNAGESDERLRESRKRRPHVPHRSRRLRLIAGAVGVLRRPCRRPAFPRRSQLPYSDPGRVDRPLIPDLQLFSPQARSFSVPGRGHTQSIAEAARSLVRNSDGSVTQRWGTE
jgi:hypothetical protein